MRLLLIGYSRIVQRKVLPALAAVRAIDSYDIATRRASQLADDPGCQAAAHVFGDYAEALSASRANLVYVSTVNSTHAQWAEAALEHGFHVIVDKPITTTLRETEALARLAEKRNQCLAESTVYPFHPRIERTRELLAGAPAGPRSVTVTFCFPHLAGDNFRYQARHGGGALLDLGAYALSPGRLFFGARPETVHGVTGRTGHAGDVETEFAWLADYGRGRTLTGHAGFGMEYRNRLTVFAEGLTVELDRVFTPPPNAALPIQVQRENATETIDAPPGNCFAAFLEHVAGDIAAGRHARWREDLLTDAAALEMLRQAPQRGA